MPTAGAVARRSRCPRPSWILAAAGAGLWFALGGGHRPAAPRASGSPSAPASAAATVRAPYRAVAVGVTQRPCTDVIPSANGRAANITFTDAARTRLLVYWLDFSGRRKLLVTLAPGDSRQVNGNVGDAWQVADSRGCVAGFVSTGAGHVTIEAAATP